MEFSGKIWPVSWVCVLLPVLAHCTVTCTNEVLKDVVAKSVQNPFNFDNRKYALVWTKLSNRKTDGLSMCSCYVQTFTKDTAHGDGDDYDVTMQSSCLAGLAQLEDSADLDTNQGTITMTTKPEISIIIAGQQLGDSSSVPKKEALVHVLFIDDYVLAWHQCRDSVGTAEIYVNTEKIGDPQTIDHLRSAKKACEDAGLDMTDLNKVQHVIPDCNKEMVVNDVLYKPE